MTILHFYRLSFMALAIIMLAPANLQARQVSGTISRVNTVNSALPVTVKVELLSGLPYFTTLLGEIELTLPASVQSSSFSFIADENGDGQIRYTLPDGHVLYPTEGTGYFKHGYYQSNENTSWKYSYNSPPATFPADSTPINGIDLKLVAAHSVTGNVSLPDGKDHDAAIMLSAGTMEYGSCGDEVDYTPYHVLTATTRTANYSLLVPDNVGEFCINFRTRANSPPFYQEKSLHYFSGQTTINADGTASSNMTTPQLFNAGQQYQSINFTMLNTEVLSGLVILPFSAPTDLTTYIFINSNNNGNCLSQTTLLQDDIRFLQGEPQSPYMFLIPEDVDSLCMSYSANGEVEYINGQWTSTPSPYWSSGYLYPDLSMGSDTNQFGSIPFASGLDLNLSVLRKRTISGQLTRQSDNDSLSLHVTAMCNYANHSIGRVSSENTSVFDPGVQETTYLTFVAEDCPEIGQIHYTLDNSTPGYLEEAYYSSEGTTWVRSLADSLVTGDHENIDLTILPANFSISGTITSPQPMDAPTTVSINLIKEIEPGEYESEFFTDVLFPVGSSSASYEIQAPDNETLTVYYGLYNSPDYSSAGYYSEISTRRKVELADWLLTDQNFTEINLSLLNKNPFPGDLNLDEHINLADIIISLELLTNKPSNLHANPWEMDINHDSKIGLAETIDTLAVVGEICSVRHSEFCTSVSLCNEVNSHWFDGRCHVFAGEWSGTWQSSQYSNHGNLWADFSQDGNNVSGTASYSGSICNNYTDLLITGIITDGLLNIASEEYQCGADTAVIQYTQAVVNNNKVTGTYVFTVAGAETDRGTFSLSRY